jgi:hypothetical protein
MYFWINNVNEPFITLGFETYDFLNPEVLPNVKGPPVISMKNYNPTSYEMSALNVNHGNQEDKT